MHLLLLGLCFRRRGTTTSVHSSAKCTCWKQGSELISSSLSLFTSVSTNFRRTSGVDGVDVIYIPPHHRHWLSAVHGCLLPATELFPSSLLAFGTVCRRMSPLHHHCPSLSVFRSRLKTHVFRRCYLNCTCLLLCLSEKWHRHWQTH